MRHLIQRAIAAGRTRALGAALMSVLLVSTTAGPGRAMQLIPSVGFTKSTDASAGTGRLSGGLALRAGILPFLSVEGGIAYRQESYANGDLKIRMWPVTTSLWLTPIPVLYAGGGVGWYRASYDYRSTAPSLDRTTNALGVHLGGGLSVPLAPRLGLDLNGRYIFMQQDGGLRFPTEFNPDFWSTSLGLAIRF